MVKRKLKLFFDMDETVVNLTESVIEEYNKDFKDNYDYKQNRSYWWSDTPAPRSYYEKILQKESVFLRAKPVKGMIETIERLHKEGFEIHIITYPTRESKFCAYEKYEWIKKYLPWFDAQKYLHCSGNKQLMASWDRVLIDDNPDYLSSWNIFGTSICFGDYGWNENYKGIKVTNAIDLHDKIWEMEKYINERLENLN